MCGLTGFLDNSKAHDNDTLRAQVERMALQVLHRGPDDSGEWTDASAGVALGFRRLAIVDLTPAGHQPMESASGRYKIIFNGEVYNFQALREELIACGKAPSFRGHSDTEIMLACIEAWGLEASVRRFAGMFAFALWDCGERVLHLVRDRIGVKPMYYARFGKVLLFGSELKSLRAHPAFRAEVNRDALTLFLRHNYIPAPYSIYRAVFKLTPGTILSIPAGHTDLPEPIPYWTAKRAAECGMADPYKGTEEEATSHLDSLLRDAVGLRMIADVPLGVFLSGGVDSSTVVALMQAQSSRPVKTFSIGFEDDAHNEAKYAYEVARHLGTEHTELYLSSDEAMDIIPKLPTLYDEPFADSSQIPTYLVSALARRSVTVSLSGDGGDELFGGYNRYFQGRSLWNKLQHMPHSIRCAASSMLTAVPPQSWDAIFKTAGPMLPRRARMSQPGDKLAKLADVMNAAGPDELYRNLVSFWKSPEKIVLNATEPLTMLTDTKQWADLDDFTLRMMYLDTVSYLPDDIMVKVDRASMGVSLEAREPLLDHRVIEFAWQVPLSMKIRAGQGKWLLRQVLYRYVPPSLIERPKMGFGIPLGDWLRGRLRGWAESLLDPKRLETEGFFNPLPIRQKWEEHLSCKRNWHYYLWGILMFQAWLEESK